MAENCGTRLAKDPNMKILNNSMTLLVGITAAYCAGISAVSAATVVVTPSTVPTLDTTHWSSAYLGDNSGGGNSTITNTAAHDGNGSIELFGDRTRFVNGNYYGGALSPSQGLLSNVQSLTFDWSVAVGSTSSLIPSASPALILYVQDGSSRSQLIWEGAYNGYALQSSVTQGTWYTSGASDRFYKSGDNDPNTAPALADFATLVTRYGYTPTAYISAIGVGVGSTIGSGYHAFADDITLTTKTGASTTYNFETNAPTSTVPDTGSTLALLGLATLALVGVRQKLVA